METKKLYIAPSIQVVTLDSDCSILAGSGGGSQLDDLKEGGDPFAAPAQSSLGTSAYFDFESEDE